MRHHVLRDVVDRLVEHRGARVLAENRWEDGPHPLLEVEHDGQRLAVLRSGVGAPLAGGLLEQVIAAGCRDFIVCGGAGTLHKDLTLGHFVVVSSALRDEGTSFHYLPAGRQIEADPEARRTLEAVLTSRNVPHVSGLTWTTDAPYRETSNKIAARRDEGCLTVEMEASALAAIARFRGVRLAQVDPLRRRPLRLVVGQPRLAEPLRRPRGSLRPRGHRRAGSRPVEQRLRRWRPRPT